jgi:hypothetical protein
MMNLKILNNNTVEIDMEGDITRQDYKMLRPKLETLMEERGKLKFLIDLRKMKHFSLGAMFEDIKFDFLNLKTIGATAIVATEKTQEVLTNAINSFFPERVHYFEQTEPALGWLKKQGT